MDIRSIGDPLEKIRARFEPVRLSTRAQAIADDKARRIAERYAEIVIEHIDLQDLVQDWEPLQESYRAWKIDQGLDPGIWIATGELRDAITFWRSSRTTGAEGERVGWLSGIPRGAVRDTGEALFIIARALEYGVPADLIEHLRPETRERIEEEREGWFIPPRPLFLPSARQVVREAKQGLL
jgi:hypothetical protein